MTLLSRTEELLLLTVWRLQDDAYSLSIQEAMSQLLDKPVSIGSIYVPLERMKRSGLLAAREGQPTDQRGGRRKRFYTLTAKGQLSLARIDAIQKKAWDGWSIPEGLNPVAS